ncbi:MAG: pyridoxamine 5'-phosphate oxidase [Sandaracinaceae bacterium]|nr:pyridoxamine 5'-phosphate oxidase [Sandaracinaceae bacterium]
MTDPIELFLACRSEARAAGAPMDATIAVLATATADGRPSARAVLVKDVEPDGFFVFTNYESRKARELEDNPFAALCIHWPETGVQFRVEGRVERVPPERSDAYFASRPRESQLGAWASAQSRPVGGREALLEAFAQAEDRFAGRDVLRPPHWGGYRIVPSRIEHWVNGEHRLHDRFLYERGAHGWTVTRLSP